MSVSFQQNATGRMAYPAKGTVNRVLFKGPLLWWRMGLGPLLGHWMVLFTTWGRISRQPRHTLASYTARNDTLYLISGWGERADWYRNLMVDPHVTVQPGRGGYSALARRVTDVEEYTEVMRDILRTGGDPDFQPWLASLDIAANLDDLVAKRDRVHMVALDPSDEPGPPPMPIDRVWLWAVPAMLLAGLYWRRRRRQGESAW